MSFKYFRRFVPFLMIMLAVMACGQVSMDVVSPATEISVVVTPAAEVAVPTPEAVIGSPENQDAPIDAADAPVEAADAPSSAIPTLAFRGTDGNLWVLDAGGETPRQVTFDASPIAGNNTAVDYYFPRISTDGTLLAFRKDIGIPRDGGYDFTSGLWVANLVTGEEQLIVDGRPADMAWKPGTHLLAFGVAVETEYFMTRGAPNAALANGIHGIDLDSGEMMVLVAPERGYALYGPSWSRDGRFLMFGELFAMEGSGLFAYYDFEQQTYVAWDEPVGFTSWSPDGSLLAYARHTYAPTGEERLYLRPRDGAEQLLGYAYDGPAYATYPVFSPSGAQIAYLAYLEGPESQTATVELLDLATGESKPAGQFEGVWELTWTPGGGQVVFSIGTWETPQIVALNVTDGSYTLLAAGTQPTLAGQ